jgi:hypothetical protein
MAVYIGRSIYREPSDQTDLKNGVDAILGGSGGNFWKRADSRAHRGWAAPWWGWAAPPGSLSGSASGVCLLESSRVGFTIDLCN